MTPYLVVYITAPNEEEAARIGRSLIEERLAACVNIVKNIRSIYRWQGAIEDEPEVLMIVKTRQGLFNRLEQKIRELHSYTVPEIIAFPVIAGSEGYLSWLADETLNA